VARYTRRRATARTAPRTRYAAPASSRRVRGPNRARSSTARRSTRSPVTTVRVVLQQSAGASSAAPVYLSDAGKMMVPGAAGRSRF